jgi:hypothetical protein
LPSSSPRSSAWSCTHSISSLGEVVEFVEPTHEYEPHVTVAYVRPEVAGKYVGNQITAGHTFVITEVVIRTQSREETIVALNG